MIWLQLKRALRDEPNKDKIKICSTWYTLLMKDVSDSCIGVQHLSQLLEGMRSWLPEENVQSLTNTISQLREALDFDGAKINHLQLALYCFQVKYLTLIMRKYLLEFGNFYMSEN